MSCILLQCKLPFGPLAFNKLIDWLMRVLLRLGSGKGVDVGRGKCPTFGRAGRCGHVSYRQTRRFHGRTESIIAERTDEMAAECARLMSSITHDHPRRPDWIFDVDGKVTVGLALHWLCVTDFSGSSTCGLTAKGSEMSSHPAYTSQPWNAEYLGALFRQPV